MHWQLIVFLGLYYPYLSFYTLSEERKVAGVLRGRVVTTDHERGILWWVHTNVALQQDLWHIIAKRLLKKDQPV